MFQLSNRLIAFSIILLFSTNINSQCTTWIGKDFQSDAENAHSIYRQAMKMKTMDIAFENWEIAYKLAPAADGNRDVHYLDGVEFYKEKMQSATGDEKVEYGKNILRLYDEAIACYQSKSIALKTNTEEAYKEKIGFLYGRKAYDMFYYVNSPYAENIEALDNSIRYSGDKAEYIIFDPYSKIIVWEFKNGLMTKEKAAELHKTLNQIAEYNISNNEKLSEGYQQAQASMNWTFTEIEGQIFDCEYFKEKLIPEYEENKDDPEVLRRVLATLKAQGCLSTDPIIVELDAVWKKYAVEENARIQAEYDANNPASAAKRLFDDGKFYEAISKYREAINADDADNNKKASYLFSIASIQFRKLNQYSEARNSAYSAAKYRPNWGRPYLLIGDMYGKTARSCGDSWNQRLAILAAIDKYAYARSIDDDVASEASSRIGSYSNSMPQKDEGFMRGVKEGDSATVGCWIGETVKLRFK